MVSNRYFSNWRAIMNEPRTEMADSAPTVEIFVVKWRVHFFRSDMSADQSLPSPLKIVDFALPTCVP